MLRADVKPNNKTECYLNLGPWKNRTIINVGYSAT